MAFKVAFLAALCVAQVFAYKPSPVAFARNVVCPNSSGDVAHAFEEAVDAFDEIRDTVDVAALDAYAKENNLNVVIACFRAQKENMRKFVERIYGMMREASQELGEEMMKEAEKYAKLMKVPLRTIAVTMRELPEKLYTHLVNHEFREAKEAVLRAREIVRENGKILSDLMQEMAAEFPELGEKARQMAEHIRDESRKGRQAIREAIVKCVEEGGPQPSQ